jgi:integrin beta 3
MTDTETIADVMAAVVNAATRPLIAKYGALEERYAALERQIQVLEARAPIPGPQGPPGHDGKRGERGENGIGLTGEPGRDGLNGKDAEPVDVDAMVARITALIPTPKDGPVGPPGRDGLNGKDAAPVDVDDVALRAAELIPKPKDGVGVAGAVIDKDGLLVLTLSDGTLHRLGIVVGEKGERGERGEKGIDGTDGRDGTLDTLRVEQMDERRWRFVRSDGTPMPGDPIYVPMMVYRGVFVEGTAYDKGDAVTFGGSLWIARETTKNKPGDGSTAWQLAAKEGRRGLQGVPGKDGERGPVGPRGDAGRSYS